MRTSAVSCSPGCCRADATIFVAGARAVSGRQATLSLPATRPVLNGGRTLYSYDMMSQLTDVTDPTGATTAYPYAPTGNRTSLTRGGTTTQYAYDGADRLQSAGATAYTSDDNGNRTGKGSGTFAFDQANRLTSASVTGGTAQYTYDGDGKRVSKTVPGPGGTTTYLYDVNRRLPVVLEDGARRYVWGLGLAYSTDVGGNVVGVYHGDGLGSIRALTDGAGVLTDSYVGDEYGVPGTGAGTSDQPFGFTGQQGDAETGFTYLRARMYDAETGRFIQRDPVAGRARRPSTLNRLPWPAGCLGRPMPI